MDIARNTCVIITGLLAHTALFAVSLVDIYDGQRHHCALLEDNSFWCWGNNTYGQLGLGNKFHRAKPTKILPSGIIAADTERYRTCAVFQDGQLKCWGKNDYGSLGLESGEAKIGDEYTEQLKFLAPVPLGDLKVKQVSLGYWHSCILSTEGKVKCWGRNLKGALGLGIADERKVIGNQWGQMGDSLAYVDLGGKAKTICASHSSTCALMEDNQVKCWGYYASVGSGDSENIGLSLEQMGEHLKPVDFGSGMTVKKLECGGFTNCVHLSDNSVKCWGGNLLGEIGIESNDSIVGDAPNEMGDRLPFVNIGTGLSIEDLQCGFRFCCVKISEVSGTKCWGFNQGGQLGLGHDMNLGMGTGTMGDYLPYTELGTWVKIKRVFVSLLSVWAELDNGKFKQWGSTWNIETGKSEYIGDHPSEVGDSLKAFELDFSH